MRLLSVLIFCLSAWAASLAWQKNQPDQLSVRNPELRIVGYLNGSNHLSQYDIDFTRITDLDIAFVNPDSMGAFHVDSSLSTLVASAHASHVRILFSIGGGNPPTYLASLLKGTNRNVLAASVAQLAAMCHFDGVDVDLENELVNNDYAPFVSTLSGLLKQAKITLTAALATETAGLINDSTMRQLDFINIMSYDKTGPWDPSRPGQHAPYSMAEQDFAYFHTTRNIASGKLLIGLPFYGYGFGKNAPQSMSYGDIVHQFPGSENADSVIVSGGGVLYYNGIPTIKKKVQLAMSKRAAGGMIWQILQDSHDSTSLLQTIHSTTR